MYFCSLVLTAAGAQRPPCFSSEQLCADSKEPGDQQLCVLRRGQRCPERGDSVCTLTVVRPSNVNDLICPFSKKTFRTLGMRRRASFFIIFWEQVGEGQGEELIWKDEGSQRKGVERKRKEGVKETGSQRYGRTKKGKSRSIIMSHGDQNQILQDTGPYQSSSFHVTVHLHSPVAPQLRVALGPQRLPHTEGLMGGLLRSPPHSSASIS